MLTRAREYRGSRAVVGCILAMLFSMALPRIAYAATGLEYLQVSPNPNGSYGGTSTSPATPVQSTAEVLRAFQVLGQSNQPAFAPALAYLNNDTEANTEFLSRKIEINRAAGTNVSALVTQLLTHQNPDGGFGNGPGEGSSILDTAFALNALAAANQPLGPITAGAVGYLLSRQHTSGGYADGENVASVYLTAPVYRALSPYRTVYVGVSTALTNAQNYLFAQRDGAGNLSENFQTALALIALIPTATDLAPISNSISALQAAELANGSWDNDPYTTALALHALWLASHRPPAAGLTAIQGTVIDAITGLPLAGVGVLLAGPTTDSQVTVADGTFRFQDIPAGGYTLTLTLSGYGTLVTTSTAASTLTLNLGALALTKATSATTGTLYGRVTDANTASALAGVTISTNTGQTASTDANGNYQIANIAPGSLTVSASRNGYTTASGTGTLVAGGSLVFSPALYPAGTPPLDGSAGVKGVVLDAGTNQPLVGVSIQATFGSVTQTLTTNGLGQFESTALTAGSGTLRFSHTGYVTHDLAVTLQPATVLDLGQVRLRAQGADVLLSDLVVTAIDISQMQNDPQTFAVTGVVNATIENRGTADANSAITVTAFQDTNANGQYDTGDIPFGSTGISGLAVQQTQVAAIVVSGNATFRDAPISVVVDSVQLVAESNEANNVNSTSSACEVRPRIGTLQPVLKWAWTGSATLPSYRQVMSTPIVAPIEDTNVDGRIDENDVPAVIFHTFSGSNYRSDGVLRAVDGKDGHELWTVTDAAYRTNPEGSIAVADIDGDGLVEIIAPKNGGGIIAFEHTGVFKWQSSVPADVFWGGASVADLNGDGTPEIVVGNTVLNADGSLLWQGTGYQGGYPGFIGSLSVVADVDLDGRPEVIAGGAAYSSSGQPLWQNDIVGEGFAAIGNFDADTFPEIAVVGNGRVSLLNHDGTLIWGPTTLPGGGRGGAPTIADVDGNGVPEIGVAGGSRYVVFKADGSVLWSAVTQDLSSNVTGSSVFDFDGDGEAEVVYADERFLRIYRGRDGAVLFSVPNTSGTTYELPVIVDVDNDGHADIVACTNDYAFSGNGSGIRVYRDANNSWVNTRKIWNQHTYHITNINDDGTVPRVEQNSWQVHNTYRLNAFPNRSGAGTPDLTAGQLRFSVNAAGANLTVRIGNGGAEISPSGVVVRFFEGNPSAGGRLLGEIPLSSLSPGSNREVTLSNITSLAGNVDLYAIVDPENRATECREDNNAISIPGPQLKADLAVVSIATTTAVVNSQTLQVSGTVTAYVSNIGTLGTATGAAILAFYDANNNGVYDSGETALGQSAVPAVPIGGSATIAIAVQGQAAFRDALISVWVDSEQAIPEISESNNVSAASNACSVGEVSFVSEPGWPVYVEDPANPGSQLLGASQAVCLNAGSPTNCPADALLLGFPASGWTTNISSIAGSLWISGPGISPSSPADLERFAFSRTFVLGPRPRGTISVAADDFAEVRVNGTSVGSIGSITSVSEAAAAQTSLTTFDLTPYLRTGANTITVIAQNGPASFGLQCNGSCTYSKNPSGVVFAGTVGPAFDDARDWTMRVHATNVSTVNSGGEAMTADLSTGELFVRSLDAPVGCNVQLSRVAPNGSVSILSTYANIRNSLLSGIALDPITGRIIAADEQHSICGNPASATGRIVLIDPANGSVDMLVDIPWFMNSGQNGMGQQQYALNPADASVLYFWDSTTAKLYRLDRASGVLTPILALDPGNADGFHAPTVGNDIAYDVATGTLLLSDGGSRAVLDVNPQTQTTTVLFSQLNESPRAIALDPTINAVFVQIGNAIYVGPRSGGSLSLVAEGFTLLRDIVVGKATAGNGLSLFALDSGNETVYEITSSQSLAQTPDLTASLLRIMDQGTTQGLRLSLRVGNAGTAPVASVVVAFYDGNSSAGGILLGTTTVANIPANGYQDIVFDTITLPSGTQDLYAVVDSTNQIVECREDNNVTHTPVTANTLGRIFAATDKPVYGANSVAVLQGLVTNSGALPASYTAQLQVEDASGALVEIFPVQVVANLAGGTSSTVTNIWNTGTTIAGNYRLHALLRDTNGALISDSISHFELRHSEQATPKVALRTTTDRPTYHITDLVNIGSLVRNITTNAILDNARLRVRVLDPTGLVIFLHEGALGQLLPGSLRDLLLPYGLNNVPLGTYRVEGEVFDTGTGENLASAFAQYQVIDDPAKSLVGTVTVASPSVDIGTNQVCTYTVTNRSAHAQNGVSLRLSVGNLITGTTVESASQTVNLGANATQTIIRSVATGALTAGDYACALEALVDGNYRSLGYAAFKVTVPPIRIDAELKIGTRGKLLILLDPERQSCRDEDDGDHDAYDNDADNEHGNRYSHGPDDDRDCTNGQDPHGPKTAPNLAAQRQFLEQLLTNAGWTYTIVDTGTSFARELKSGAYSAYGLFSEHVKLSQTTQKALREAVFRGEGLLLAGSHDNRNQKLNEALGLKRIGTLSTATRVTLPAGILGVEGTTDLLTGDRINRIKRLTAQSLATYELSAYGNDTRCDDEDDERETNECDGRHPDTYIDAITFNPYGSGKAIFAGFDLLAQATKEGATGISARTLLGALGASHPTPIASSLGRVLPIDLKLTNRGIATTATVTIAVPNGATVDNAGGGTVTAASTGTTLSFTVNLGIGEEQTLRFGLKLPNSEAIVNLRAGITAGNRLITETDLAITVTAIVAIDDLVQQAQTLASQYSVYRHTLNAAQNDLDKAAKARSLDKAIDYALKATDNLLGITEPEIVTLRQRIDGWLRYMLMLAS